jgi:hypothetical protein
MPQATTIGGLVVLVLLIAFIFCYYKFVPKASDKDSAVSFIKGYTSVFEKTIEKVIESIDITSYKTIEDFEMDIFNLAYDECWTYTEKALQEALANSAIGSLVAKCVTKESTCEVIQAIINSSFSEMIQNKYVKRVEETTAQAVAADAEAQAEADLYEAGEKEVEPYVEPEPSQPEVPLNPQTDEEGEYSKDDISQEIVGDVKEEEGTIQFELPPVDEDDNHTIHIETEEITDDQSPEE